MHGHLVEVPELPDGIDGVIQELVAQDAVATIAVPEKERTNRTPTAGELAHPDHGPSVMIEDSLWLEVDRPIECRPQGTATALGTIPPPMRAIGAYCILDQPSDTEKVETVAVDYDVLDDVLDEMDTPDMDEEDDELELDVELEIDFDDIEDL